MILNNGIVFGFSIVKSFFHWKNAHGISLYLAPEANDYDSLADIAFSRLLQN